MTLKPVTMKETTEMIENSGRKAHGHPHRTEMQPLSGRNQCMAAHQVHQMIGQPSTK